MIYDAHAFDTLVVSVVHDEMVSDERDHPRLVVQKGRQIHTICEATRRAARDIQRSRLAKDCDHDTTL